MGGQLGRCTLYQTKMSHNLEIIQSTYLGNKQVGDEVQIGFSVYIVTEREDAEHYVRHVIELKNVQ